MHKVAYTVASAPVATPAGRGVRHMWPKLLPSLGCRGLCVTPQPQAPAICLQKGSPPYLLQSAKAISCSISESMALEMTVRDVRCFSSLRKASPLTASWVS
jgi:hypothetical protein